MYDQASLAHSRWECKYHVVFVPKFRRKIFYGQISKELSPVLAQLARQKECTIIKGHFMPDHVQMLISIPPKYSVAQVTGYIKGKSAIISLGTTIIGCAILQASTFGLVVTLSQL
jgi:putative transposase